MIYAVVCSLGWMKWEAGRPCVFLAIYSLVGNAKKRD